MDLPCDLVNDFIDARITKVICSSFDDIVYLVKRLGKGALCGKKDIKTAFRLLKVYPGDFNLLGIKFLDEYYVDKCMPMGCSISCSTFEIFSTFLH
jgi:hypothetical protein